MLIRFLNSTTTYWQALQRNQRHCLVFILCALCPVLAAGQSNYAAFELKRENNFDPLLLHDINGDGTSDLIVSSYAAGVGRELLIYLQQENGNFDANPVRVEIKTEIIAVGFADLRPDPGLELVLLANNGVFSLNAMQPGYAGNIKQLLSWDLIASMPNLESVQFFDSLVDLNNDGHVDMILPGIDHYGIFQGKGNEQFELVSRVNTINTSTAAMERSNRGAGLDARVGINPEDGVILQVSSNRRTPFSELVEQWQGSDAESDYLLRSERWMPALVHNHLNSDNLRDLIYLNVGEDGLGQLNIHYQSNSGEFSALPDWTASLDTSGNWQLVDINHDAVMDLLRLRGEGDEWTVQFFLNKEGKFDLAQPNQVMRFSGYDVRLNFLQLEPGAAPVLNVNYYTIPVVDAIRNASINRTQLLYGSDTSNSGLIFNRRPDSRLEESFSATNVRGLSEQMSLRYDVDGDGMKDALYITDNGTLAAKKISRDLQIASQPFWEYVSSRNVFQFEVLQLNSDTIPDLLLRHGTSTTMLVGRP